MGSARCTLVPFKRTAIECLTAPPRQAPPRPFASAPWRVVYSFGCPVLRFTRGDVNNDVAVRSVLLESANSKSDQVKINITRAAAESLDLLPIRPNESPNTFPENSARLYRWSAITPPKTHSFHNRTDGLLTRPTTAPSRERMVGDDVAEGLLL